MRAPKFWSTQAGVAAALLSPLSLLFRAGGALRAFRVKRWRAPAPVICVGNLTAGGSGKTPTALALGALLQDGYGRVAYVTRGYGGSERGPHQVDPASDPAERVGDEPLLLARVATTWVARNRKEGVQAAIAEGADIVILDDGLQYPALRPHLSIVVVDGPFGFGNEHVIPAGPLREPIDSGLARAQAAILIGDDPHGLATRLHRRVPVLRARLAPTEVSEQLRGHRVYAFAGIGRPNKFFATLRDLGAVLAGTVAFADHHRFSAAEIARLRAAAQAETAQLVTTEKDFVRLPDILRAGVTPVGVALRFDDPAAIDALLKPVRERAHA